MKGGGQFGGFSGPTEWASPSAACAACSIRSASATTCAILMTCWQRVGSHKQPPIPAFSFIRCIRVALTNGIVVGLWIWGALLARHRGELLLIVALR